MNLSDGQVSGDVVPVLSRDLLCRHVQEFQSTMWLSFRRLYPHVTVDGLSLYKNGRCEPSLLSGDEMPSRRQPNQRENSELASVINEFEHAGFAGLKASQESLVRFAASSVQHKHSAKRLLSDPWQDFDLSPLGYSIASHAFSDIRFKFVIAVFIKRVLKHRVVFYPEAAPQVSLSTPTFLWMLDAAQLLPRLRKPEGPHYSVSPLALIGPELEDLEGWAGFWDQFFLIEARRHHGRASTVVEALPLVKDGQASLSADPIDDPKTVRGAWRQEVPVYAESLLKGQL